MTEAYPLAWPAHVRRRTAAQRIRAAFGKTRMVKSSFSDNHWRQKEQLSVAEAIRRLFAEIDRMGARYTVISSNVEIRQDGLPRSDRREPVDPGVAVYFRLNDKPYCLPCDRYDRVADNIAAQAVIGSQPDGYRLLVVTTASAINATLYPQLPFNFLRDVAPVARLVRMVNLVVVHPSVPVNTLGEFIAPVIEKSGIKGSL